MTFYRIEARQYASMDDDEGYPIRRIPNATIITITLHLVKETAKGYWIAQGGQISSPKRWISKTSKKRYAYPSLKEAYENFIKRTTLRVGYLKEQIWFCDIAIDRCQTLLKQMENG